MTNTEKSQNNTFQILENHLKEKHNLTPTKIYGAGIVNHEKKSQEKSTPTISPAKRVMLARMAHKSIA
ncbi:MAG: hypothetical protein ACK5N8_08200 [Alphaproteobacteria bacterium]